MICFIKKIKHIFDGCSYRFYKNCDVEKYKDLDQFKCRVCGHITLRKHVEKYNYKVTKYKGL